MTDKKESKTLLEIKRERIEKLKQDKIKAEEELKVLQARQKKKDEAIARTKENALKNHVGGTANMVGLLDYVYDDKALYDNQQDELIENLLAGAFLKAAEYLSQATTEQLIATYQKGYTLRQTKKNERTLPPKNSNLNELFDYIRNKKITEKTQDSHNDNV